VRQWGVMKNFEQTFTVTGKTHKLSDLVRKVYAVEKSADGILWDEISRHNNSTEAGEALKGAANTGLQTRLVVVEITSTPKKAFWELWRTKEGKSAIQAAGIFVTKESGNFVVTDTKPSRRKIIRDKGYGERGNIYGQYDQDTEDYILKSKCRGEFECLEAEGYGHLITDGDRRIEAEHQAREDAQ
jgi:hypothetical protein